MNLSYKSLVKKLKRTTPILKSVADPTVLACLPKYLTKTITFRIHFACTAENKDREKN